MAIAALVLGIVAVVFAFLFPPAGVGAGVVGIILAVMARKEAKTGQSTAGLVLSVIGLALAAILWIACQLCVSGVKKGFEKGLEDVMKNPEIQKGLEELQDNPEFQKGLEELNKALEDAKQ